MEVHPSQISDPVVSGALLRGNNIWEPFLGPHPDGAKFNGNSVYDRYDRATDNLPAAYHGKNLYLGRSVEMLIYNQNYTWQTTVALPWTETDQLSAKWDILEFNPGFTTEVPHQGVSRLLTNVKESREVGFVRRGVGLFLEHGFMRTPEGREKYQLQLRQLARAVQETANFSVIYAYLDAHTYLQGWKRRHGYNQTPTFREIRGRRKFMWAILQKEKYGAAKLDERFTTMMSEYHGDADMWIYHPAAASYLRLARPERIDYNQAGPLGPMRANLPPAALTESDQRSVITADRVLPYDVFNGSMVYLTRMYKIDRNAPIDPLARLEQDGEYNVLLVDQTSKPEDYRSIFSSIRVYDEEKDGGVNLGLRQGVEWCNIWNEEDTGVRVDFITDMVSGLEHVFFLKPDAAGTSYVGIDRIGEIQERFLSSRDIVRMAKAYRRHRGNAGAENPEVAVGEGGVNSNIGLVGADVGGDHQSAELALNLLRECAKDPVATVDAAVGATPTERYHSVMRTFKAPSGFSVSNFDKESEFRRYIDEVEVGYKLSVDAAAQRQQQQSFDRFSDFTQQHQQYVGQTASNFFNTEVGAPARDARTSAKVLQAVGLELDSNDANKKGLQDHVKYILNMRFTKANMLKLIDMDVPLPMNFIFARPHMEYLMAMGIKTKAGRETGATFHGHADFEMGDDPATKTHLGHFTHYMHAQVTNPRNVMVASGILCLRRMGGLGTRPWIYEKHRDKYRPPEAEVHERDMFVFAVPLAETEFPIDMDVSGRLSRYDNDPLVDVSQENAFLHYTTAPYYNAMWGFYEPGQLILTDDDEPMERMVNVPINTIVSQGRQGSYNPTTGDYDRNIIVNKGVWGEHVYAGVQAVRDGRLREMREIGSNVLGF